MIKSSISASMMCANYIRLEQDVKALEAAKVEYLHFDIMDGVFVPNLMLNNEMMKSVRAVTSIPFDVHLMIADPEFKIKWFDLKPGDTVSVHYESTPHVHRALHEIKSAGARAAVALNPATPVESVKYLLNDIDTVTVMCVDPGFSGQKLIPQCIGKIRDMRNYLDQAGHGKIGVQADGNCSFANCALMREAGADCFVAGTSSVFTKEMPLAEAVAKLRQMIR